MLYKSLTGSLVSSLVTFSLFGIKVFLIRGIFCFLGSVSRNDDTMDDSGLETEEADEV